MSACQHILIKKGRQCKMLVKAGARFCGEHAIFEDGNTTRMICPNDKNHTILISELEIHLTRCNSRIRQDEEFINIGANAVIGETKHDAKIDRRATEEEIVDVAHKIWRCYEEEVKEKLIVMQMKNDMVEEYLKENDGLGEEKKKHLVQISSILGHIITTNVLPSNPNSCMFELGAGKGQLAYWISKIAPNAHLILMDRSGSRNKHDKKALKENPNISWQRFRCSIEHMDLSKIDVLKNSTKILAVCKHFCGSATDAGIRSLLNSGLNFDSAVLIPCCHHKSRFVEYGGLEFLRKWGMDSEEAFAALRYIVSFATNGAPKVEKEDENSWKSLYPPLELGRRAKAILEVGRAEWLKTVGYETRVIEYVPPSVSPENLLIFATRK